MLQYLSHLFQELFANVAFELAAPRRIKCMEQAGEVLVLQRSHALTGAEWTITFESPPTV